MAYAIFADPVIYDDALFAYRPVIVSGTPEGVDDLRAQLPVGYDANIRPAR